jgi:hypothetical protein
MSHNSDQYNAIRNEIIRSIEDGNQILAFGIATIGIILNAIISVKDNTAGFLAFVYLVPIVQMTITSIWFSAQERMARASYFLTSVERCIAREGGGSAGGMWEHWLRNHRGSSSHFLTTEYSVFALQGLTVLSCIAYGVFTYAKHIELKWMALYLMPVGIFSTLFVLMMRRRFRRWYRWLNEVSYDTSES